MIDKPMTMKPPRMPLGASSDGTPRQWELTVSALYRPGWHAFPVREQVPLLQLAGPWLEKAGFYPGAEVTVRAEEGRVVVLLRGRVDVAGEEEP